MKDKYVSVFSISMSHAECFVLAGVMAISQMAVLAATFAIF